MPVLSLARQSLLAEMRGDQPVQRALRATIWDARVEGLLAPGQRAEIRHRPVETGQLQQARREPGRLPKRHAEEDFDREARLDGCVAVGPLAATFAEGTASHTIAGSNQTVSDPRCLSARLRSCRFVVL